MTRSNASGGQSAGVGHGDRGIGDVVVEVRVVALGDVLATQHREHSLDRGDHDVGGAEHPGTGELVGVVDLGEAATVARGAVVLELRQCLLGEVVAVDEEQDPAEATELEQSVRRGHRRERLARTGGHLHEGTVEVLVGEALLDAVDRSDLGRTQSRLVQRRQVADLGPPRRVCPGRHRRSRTSLRESGWLGEVEHPSCPRVRVVAVREVRLRPAGFEDERETTVDRDRPKLGLGWQAGGVHRGLPLDSRQRGALRLGLDDADDLRVDVEQVVSTAMAGLHHSLPAGDPIAGEEVEVLLVLDRPSGVAELAVDQHACALLRRQPRILNTGIHGRPCLKVRRWRLIIHR
jgi:hypothetical protein